MHLGTVKIKNKQSRYIATQIHNQIYKQEKSDLKSIFYSNHFTVALKSLHNCTLYCGFLISHEYLILQFNRSASNHESDYNTANANFLS